MQAETAQYCSQIEAMMCEISTCWPMPVRSRAAIAVTTP